MSNGGRAIFGCLGFDLINGSEWQAIAARRSTESPESLYGSDRWSFHRAFCWLMRNGGTPSRTGDRVRHRDRSVVVRLSRTCFGAFTARVLVDADLFLRRKSDRDICHVLSRAA